MPERQPTCAGKEVESQSETMSATPVERVCGPRTAGPAQKARIARRAWMVRPERERARRAQREFRWHP
eukprot:scaffold36361_cov64-Phaeocystis_antarctica.AAC.1